MTRVAIISLMSAITKCIKWFDRYGMIAIVTFLLVFIPLWPKIPVFSFIEQYNVRVRLEDFLVLFASIAWLIQVVRKKVNWKSPILSLYSIYVAVGFVSLAVAILVLGSIPVGVLHIGKSTLHWLRYIEYFMLFLIGFASIKKTSDLQVPIIALALTTILVSIYGYGQKEFYWPLWSTMNREFSKGQVLVLTEGARVQSTFAGHYDLGAWLVLVAPILLAAWFLIKKQFIKWIFGTSFLFALWILMASGSKTSVVAFLAGSGLVVLILSLQKTSIFQKITWAVSRGTIILILALSMFFLEGDDIYRNFLAFIQNYPTVHTTYHTINGWRIAATNNLLGKVDDTNARPERTLPPNAIAVNPETGEVTQRKPVDVLVDVPDIVEETIIDEDGNEQTILVDKGPRVYSECSTRYSLSLCIRLESLWPMAWQGFLRNPITGKGYATLNKTTDQQFTEADSIDNNFLRTLGETGLLGFISFYGTMLFIVIWSGKYLVLNSKSHKVWEVILVLGFLAGNIGLFLNAIYIDVFAASKVAYSYWGIAGLVTAILVHKGLLANRLFPVSKK